MRAHVLEDMELVKLAGRFVWLTIDREQPRNAPFLERYASTFTPTYWVIDAQSGTAALKWIGIATVAQMQRLLEDGERAIRSGSADAAEAALARADRFGASGKPAEAAVGYREALARAAPGWSRRDRAVESLTFALDEAGDKAGCVQAAIDELPKMERGASFANVAGNGFSCALDYGQGADVLGPFVVEALRLSDVGADRRSELCQLLVEEAKKRGDATAARTWAEKWLEFLEGEAGRAKTPEARAVYDAHRLSAALELGQPQRVIGALEQSERDLPHDFNPPARLCVAYLQLDRLADAEAACRRALSRGMDGPRRLRVLGSLADVLEKKGDPTAARVTLEEALRFSRALPAPQRSQANERHLNERIERLRR